MWRAHVLDKYCPDLGCFYFIFSSRHFYGLYAYIFIHPHVSDKILCMANRNLFNKKKEAEKIFSWNSPPSTYLPYFLSLIHHHIFLHYPWKSSSSDALAFHLHSCNAFECKQFLLFQSLVYVSNALFLFHLVWIKSHIHICWSHFTARLDSFESFLFLVLLAGFNIIISPGRLLFRHYNEFIWENLRSKKKERSKESHRNEFLSIWHTVFLEHAVCKKRNSC